MAQFPNYWVDTDGAFDLLVTPAFNPTGHSTFSFDVAYQVYADYVDGLEVWGRAGDDDAWTVLWSAYGNELAVDGCYTWFWYDTGGTIQWANHVLDLPSAWTDGSETCLELAFANVGDYGNHIWVDNVNLDAVSTSEEVSDQAQIQLFPNPNQGACVVVVPDAFSGLRTSCTMPRVAWCARADSSTREWRGKRTLGAVHPVNARSSTCAWVVK